MAGSCLFFLFSPLLFITIITLFVYIGRRFGLVDPSMFFFPRHYFVRYEYVLVWVVMVLIVTKGLTNLVETFN